MARLFFAASAIAFMAIAVRDVPAASVTLAVPDCQAAPGGEIKVPIQARRAEGVGSFQFELTYDPALLEFQEVEEGPMLSGAMLASNIVTPGRVKLAGVGDPKQPLHGDGELVLVRFRVLDEGGEECPIAIENARAWEQTDAAFDMLVKTETGQFRAERDSRVWVLIAAGAGLLVMLAVLFAARRKRTGRV